MYAVFIQVAINTMPSGTSNNPFLAEKSTEVEISSCLRNSKAHLTADMISSVSLTRSQIIERRLLIERETNIPETGIRGRDIDERGHLADGKRHVKCRKPGVAHDDITQSTDAGKSHKDNENSDLTT